MLKTQEFIITVAESGFDRVTPITLYANLRQVFPESLLLECSEYRSPENANSYICADPILKFSVKNGVVRIEKVGRLILEAALNTSQSAVSIFNQFKSSIRLSQVSENTSDLVGIFGYIGYSAIPYFEDIELINPPPDEEKIPDMQFALYRYVFRLDHFRNRIMAIELREAESEDQAKPISDLLVKITNKRVPEYEFNRIGGENQSISDADFASTVEVCKRHIQRGDVFQIVPSRKFTQRFRGDEFQVYRALRQINPSPFLFFFDYGNFSLFGSSPEAQLIIKNSVATMHPIAGTYPRGASIEEDIRLAENLKNDSKELAEHVMLVDLARNDLGRHCQSIKVNGFKEIEFYSHVIHLVSRVSGKLNKTASAMQILADTFPAGTLSGAPKYRAMEIINKLEPSGRSFYGGSVGIFGLNGDCTQAIMIRTFLSKQRQLIFQAGAGIVAGSLAENETAEVGNKLKALRKAIEAAENGFE